MGAALLVLGALLQLSAIVLRGLAVHRAPWGNMYEYGMAVTFITVVTWLIVMWKFPVRHLTGFLLLPVVILMFINGTLLYTIAAPVQPALQSYWLAIHVSAAIIGSGVFLVPGVASVLFLFRAAYDKDNTKFARFASKLPAADVLDRIAYRTTIFAFPVFTFGVLCGAVWAESAWGRFWGWDPKETVAFIAWVVYAAYLHSRATAALARRPGGGHQHRRVRRDHLQPVLREPRHRGLALLRRGGLSNLRVRRLPSSSGRASGVVMSGGVRGGLHR